MGCESEDFSISGPLHLTAIDWGNDHHRRSIAASLVQGVYILERDRQLRRLYSEALAPPWWKFFHFKLLRLLIDDADSSIFGAVYEYKPQASSHLNESLDKKKKKPGFVIAFRGTLTERKSITRDFELDACILGNELHRTSRFKIAIQDVRNTVETAGDSDVWLAGHSLGAAMAMLAGKAMAKTNNYLQAFLLNPPFISIPTVNIKDERVKKGIRIGRSLITAGLAHAMRDLHLVIEPEDSFSALALWVPHLFVNPADTICSEYIGYFEHRNKMEEIGIGGIERVATQNSVIGLVASACGKHAEPPMHLIPSANVTSNVTPRTDPKKAHGIRQWWRPDIDCKSKLYTFK